MVTDVPMPKDTATQFHHKYLEIDFFCGFGAKSQKYVQLMHSNNEHADLRTNIYIFFNVISSHPQNERLRHT